MNQSVAARSDLDGAGWTLVSSVSRISPEGSALALLAIFVRICF